MEAQGHVIDCAMDGIGGLHLALIQWFDVTVLDIMRPGTDGLTYCWKLRVDAEKHMPVLMLSSHMYAPRQTVDKTSKHP
jgi:DNA-binding response OmpR family regulator